MLNIYRHRGGITMKKRQILIIVAALCSVAAITASGAIGFQLGQQSVDVSGAAAVETMVAQAPEAGSIAIPGFDRMSVKAGETVQEATLYNPEANECYFVLSIYMPDGTEIYHSSKLAPGETLDSIELARPLEAGTYEDATLRYACYDFDDLKPLNGAEINFILEVKP
jgi:hypothetical protein